MKIRRRSTPRSQAASRLNGKRGGTKSPWISRWNSLKHGCYVKKLSIIREGKHRPEYGEQVESSEQLRRSLPPLHPEDLDLLNGRDLILWLEKLAFRTLLVLDANKVPGETPRGYESLLREIARLERISLDHRKQIQAIRTRQAPGSRNLDHEDPATPPKKEVAATPGAEDHTGKAS